MVTVEDNTCSYYLLVSGFVSLGPACTCSDYTLRCGRAKLHFLLISNQWMFKVHQTETKARLSRSHEHKMLNVNYFISFPISAANWSNQMHDLPFSSFSYKFPGPSHLWSGATVEKVVALARNQTQNLSMSFENSTTDEIKSWEKAGDIRWVSREHTPCTTNIHTTGYTG